MRELAALACAAATAGYCLYLAPSWEPRALLSDPCGVAAVASVLVVLSLIVTRQSQRGIAGERALLALFLAVMPVIYLARGWLFGSGTESWLWIEGAGALAFGALAWLGYRRSPWFLVAGIPAHGILWDAWHLHSTYIPAWYAIGCLAVDVGLGLYVAVRLRAWPPVSESRR